MRKTSLGVFSALVLSGVAIASQEEDPLRADAELIARADAIHARVLTLDTHVDIPLNFATHEMDPGGFTRAQVDLPKMRAGGLDAAFYIVYTPQGPLTNEGYAAAQEIARTRLDAIHRFVRAYPADAALVKGVKEARRVAKEGKRAIFIGMENAFPLGPSPLAAEWWRDAGVRYMGITHFGHNQFGDSSNPNDRLGDEAEKHGGLSDAGIELVRLLNALGVMVDVSHAGKATMLEAISVSTAPIIASHSGAKAIADSPRNLDDEQLIALRDNGGVVQLVALDTYVKPYTEEQTAFREDLRKELGLETPEQRANALPSVIAAYERRLEGMWEIEPRASVSDFVDHIDHAVKVAGIDHVGIASDFDGGGGIDGWENASETVNVTRELVRRGYSEADIEKIWGGNLLRVLGEVEKTASR